MKRNNIIHAIAGLFILAGLSLGYTVHEYWYFLTAFVGLNLFQNAFSNWCLLEDILKAFKIGE